LVIEEVISHVIRPGAGGIDVFVGVVRDTSNGRVVQKLEYSAYDAMARREMNRIVLGLESEMPGVTVAAIHRLGALGVGDVAVLCAASAPHRGEAFHACRELVDRIKAQVPIWKQEYGPDGPRWVGW
jgi:molybdopterin synthase catalytic subunit